MANNNSIPENNSISISEMIHRDTGKKEYKTYQLQANQDDQFVKAVFTGYFNDIPVIPIFDVNYSNYLCNFFSFLVTDEEVCNEKYLKMISCLVQLDNSNNLESKNNKIIASVDFCYQNDYSLKQINDDNNKINEGKFLILLNDSTSHQIIKTFDKYPGKEQSLYILLETTKTLLDNVHEKY